MMNTQFLLHLADLKIFAHHIQTLETLATFRQTKELLALKHNGKRNHPNPFCIHTLEGVRKFTLDTATTVYHSYGTTAMLPKEKEDAVDEKLIIHTLSIAWRS